MERPSSKFAGNKLFKLLISSATILPLNATSVVAAPAVNGTDGCVVAYGGHSANPNSDRESGGGATPYKCGMGDQGSLVRGNYVSAAEVNNAFQQIQSEYRAYVDEQVSNSNSGAKDDEQDARLNGHDRDVTNINNTNADQQNQLNNHSTRLDSVEQKNTEQDARLSGHDRDITNLNNTNSDQQNQLNDHSTRIEAGEQKNTEQDGRLDGVEQKNVAQDGRLNDIEQKNVAQDGRLDGVEQKNAEQDGRLDDVEQKNVAQDGRLDDVEQKNVAQDGRLDGVEQKNVAQDGRLDDVEQKNVAQDGRLNGVEQKNVAQDSRLDDVEQKGLAQESRLDGVEQKNVAQDGRLDGHDREIAGIKNTGVFYNNDANGNKTGGLTLNDGTGGPVHIRNVAAGRMATDAVNVAQLDSTVAALGGGAKINADGTVQAPVYEVAGLSYNNVGAALKATNEAAVQYVTDGNGRRTNNVVLTGDGSGPVRIQNVGDGKADTDAANVRQVRQATQEAKNYTDQRFSDLQQGTGDQFSSLSSRIERNQQEARGGIASAMAMAGLRFDNNPGKLSFASGLGSFKGATSIVAGLGYTSEDGIVRFNASMGYNFGEDDLSWNAGASFTLN